MSQCLRIASVAELPLEGEVREFIFGSIPVFIARLDGVFSALGSVCPHKGGPLAEGSIEDRKLVCPWHGWEFRLADGQCANRPGASVKIFELIVHGEDVFLRS